jgi:hypothetical protein
MNDIDFHDLDTNHLVDLCLKLTRFNENVDL